MHRERDESYAVRHRIDGLEKTATMISSNNCVRHRIDGLETRHRRMIFLAKVRHRIDGLEKYQPMT